MRLGKKTALVSVAALALSVLSANVRSAVIYSVTGSTYSQNFDTLPNTPTNTTLGNSPAGWTDDNAAPGAGNFSIVGWYLYHPTLVTEGGFNGHQRFRNSSGNSGTGSYYSFGALSSTERALGDIGANTLAVNGDNMYYALRLTNSTADTLTDFVLNFNGEQWRQGASTTQDPITFAYSLNATTATFFDNTNVNATYTQVPSATFNAPQSAAFVGGQALDGNAAANRTALSATVSGISWAPGSDLWLRWASLQDPGTDHGMSIDDVNFTATVVAPEPASLSLLALLPLVARRRRSR